jgi:hypothetical protein
MDSFAAGMVARGPTFAPDRATWTGSLHVLDLPSAAAAEDFVEREPYNRAGLFENHVIRRFDNLLRRTMWDFADATGDPRYLALAHLRDGQAARAPALDFTAAGRDRLILHGDLFTADGLAPAGFALALEAPARESVHDLVARGLAGSGARFDVDILDWEFGGRR